MNYSYNNFIQLKKSPRTSVKANILSSSMEPWLRIDDQVTVKTAKAEELKPFDIILFWRKDIFICHVFLKIDNDFLITKPLHGKKIDPPSHTSNLLGIVTDPKFSFFQKIILRFLSRKIQ